MLKNEAQEQAIHNIYGQTIIIACPGSGKTTTLLRRIDYMISQGIDPASILMITFTKAAATEMKNRFEQQYIKNSGVTFSTIHSLCLSVVKKFGGFSLNNILSDPAGILMDIVVKDYSINDKRKFITDIINDISMVKNNQIDIKKYEPKCCDDRDKFIKIYNAYETVKQEEGKLDFDDILIWAYKILSEEPDTLDWLRDRYAFIHVDEYQDTNYIQRDIIYLITGPEGNLTVVGDDDQSIYAFRGAKPEIMLNFKKDYSEAKEIYMSTNYRSDKEIISHASSLIQRNIFRYQKEIIASSQYDGSVSVVIKEGKPDEITAVVKRISYLVSHGVPPECIAVLYRNNIQASSMADALMKANIPFYSNETIESRYNHWMFYDLVSYLKIAEKTGNQADYLRTVNHPNRYLSDGNIISCGYDAYKMIRQTDNRGLESWKRKKKKESILSYFSVMDYIGSLPMKRRLSVILKRAKYKSYIEDYAKYRKESVDDLLYIWGQYESDIKNNDIQTIDALENYAKRYNYRIRMVSHSKEGVCLSTMHRSKGLEWPYVFIIDCIDGITPAIREDEAVDIEEERRLFYVAMTRAKHSLFLCAYRSNGQKDVSLSRFLSESGISYDQLYPDGNNQERKFNNVRRKKKSY